MFNAIAIFAAGVISIANPCGFKDMSAFKAPDGGVNVGGVLICDNPSGYHIFLKQKFGILVTKDIENSDHPTRKLFLYHLSPQDLDKEIVLKANK